MQTIRNISIFVADHHQRTWFMRVWIAILLSLLLMLISLGLAGPMDLFSFLNADTLYFYSMYNDLLVEGNGLLGWDLNTTFNLVPNALLYLITLSLVNHPVIGQIIHGLLQYGLFLWAVWYMLRALKPDITEPAIAVAMLLPSWFFLNAMHSGNFFLAAQFFHPYHFGALIMTCILLGLNIRQLRSASTSRGVWILVLVALATFSNRIFLMMFVGPWVLVLAVLWWLSAAPRRRGYMLNAALNGAGVLAGILIFVGVKNIEGLSFQPTKMFSWENVGPSFKALAKAYLDFLVKSPVLGGIIIGALILFVISLVLVVRHARLVGGGRKVLPATSFHFLLFTMFFVPVVFLAPAINGMFFSMASARYNFMVMIWMMLAAAPLMQRLWRGKPWQLIPHRSIFLMVALATALAALLLSGGQSPGEGLRQLANYYPEKARCIDRAAKEYNLKDGVAVYWSAKPVTAFSREGIHVRQVYHNLRPYFLGASSNWYYPYKKQGPGPVFNFILHDNNLDTQAIHDTFGTRIDTLNLEGCVIYLVPDFSYRQDKSIVILGKDTSADEQISR